MKILNCERKRKIPTVATIKVSNQKGVTFSDILSLLFAKW